MTPKLRQILYVIGLVIFTGLTVLSTFKIIDPNTAASVSAALTTILGLFGVTGFGVAANAVNKQIKNGAFEDVSPADQAVAAIQATVAQAGTAVSDLDRVRQAAADAVNSATQVTNAVITGIGNSLGVPARNDPASANYQPPAR